MSTNVHSPAKKEPVPVLLKVREVARLLSVSRHTVHNLIDAGDLTVCEVNPSAAKARKHQRITRKSLLKFYQKRAGHNLKLALDNPFDS